MLIRILSAVSVAVVAGGIAIAQDGVSPAPEKMDVPQENVLDALAVTTKDEARDYGKKEFALADANADGKIDKGEFAAFAKAQLEAQSAEKTALAAAEAPAEGAVVASDVAARVTAEAPHAAETANEAPVTPDELFADIGKGEDSITKKLFIDARLASFAAADADDNGALDEAEKADFAARLWRRQTH